MTRREDEMLIQVIAETLTDQSQVYNVQMGELVFHAWDEQHAIQLADELQAAIDRHTVDYSSISLKLLGQSQ